MKYSCELVVKVPRERMLELFDSRDNQFEWQEGLVSFDHSSGEPGQVGAKSDLVYKMGKREIRMVETITERDLPDKFSGTYEADGIWNLVENTFTEHGEDTHWRVDTEFECKGFFLNLMARFAPSMFKKQTMKFMKDFAAFAEKNA